MESSAIKRLQSGAVMGGMSHKQDKLFLANIVTLHKYELESVLPLLDQ